MPRKPLFATVRKMLGRSVSQPEVAAPDGTSAILLQDSVPCVPNVNAAGPLRTVGPDGLTLIRQFEGCAKRRGDGKFEAYPDPGTGGEPWTIGWGATGKDIARGTVWTKAQCDARLDSDIARFAAQVSRAIGDARTSQQQFDALVSFHYNTGAIARATLTRKHMAGDFAGAAREFDRWVHAGGRVMKGLVRRRAAEAALYRKG